MLPRLLVLCALVFSTASAGPRSAKQIAYVGVHPIPAEAGGGFCDIEGPHVHIYKPERADVLFRVVNGAYLFVGDPMPYHYDGPKHAYYGRHPIPVDELVEGDHREHDGDVFCYLDGPHYHVYAPPPKLKFVERSDAYWYVGPWPKSYQADGPRYQKINAVYTPLHYERPVVTIASAPVEFHIPVVEVVRAPAPPPGPMFIVVDDYDYDLHYYHHHHRHHHHHHDDDDDDD